MDRKKDIDTHFYEVFAMIAVHGMDKESEFWEAVPQQPIAQLAVARDGFAPGHKYFDGILLFHTAKERNREVPLPP